MLIAKSPAFVPVSVKLLMPAETAPVFCTVTDWGALVLKMGCWLKLSCDVTARETAAPVPESDVMAGFGVPLLPTCRLAVYVAAASGVKVTTIWQELPDARLDPHVVVLMAKSLGLAPPSDMPLRLIANGPAFCTVASWPELVVPTPWVAKAIEEVMVSEAGVAVPDSSTV